MPRKKSWDSMSAQARDVAIDRALLALLERLLERGGHMGLHELVGRRKAHVKPLYEAALERSEESGLVFVQDMPQGKTVHLRKRGRELAEA